MCVQPSEPAASTCVVPAASSFKKQILPTVTGVRSLSKITRMKLRNHSSRPFLSSTHHTTEGRKKAVLS